MSITLYWFSGTGNSLKVARDLEVELENGTLNSIAKAFLNKDFTCNSEKIGFIFPLYYYGLPKIVHNFVESLNIDKVIYIFAIITRAGEDDGVPLIQLEKLLRAKGKRLNSGFFIMMPENFIIGSDLMENDEMTELFNLEKIEIKKISKIIKKNKITSDIKIDEGKPNHVERGNLRFHKNVNNSDSSFFVDENCTKCGICEKICPVNNIILIDGKPQWQHGCQQCLSCINYCPVQSIQFGKNTHGRGRYHHPEITAKDLFF